MKEQERGCIKQHEDERKQRVRCSERYEGIFENVMTHFSLRQTLQTANSAGKVGEKIRKGLIKWCYMNVFCRRTFHRDCTKKENDIKLSSSKEDQRKTSIFTRTLKKKN